MLMGLGYDNTYLAISHGTVNRCSIVEFGLNVIVLKGPLSICTRLSYSQMGNVKKSEGNMSTLNVTLLPDMRASQCGNDHPGFGLLSVSQKLRAYNIKRVLNIIKLNSIILYNYNIGF
jgi:hypothetical protein